MAALAFQRTRKTRRHRVRRGITGTNADAIGMRPTKAERVCMDSPLEGAGFELLVPLCIDAAGAGQMTAIYGARVSERPLFS